MIEPRNIQKNQLKYGLAKSKSQPRGRRSSKVSIVAFNKFVEEELEKLHTELKEQTYTPLPVRRVQIPKRDKPEEKRSLGIPAIRDRVCQQALKGKP